MIILGGETYTVPENWLMSPKLLPTFGPVTTISGFPPSKNGGPKSVMPNLAEVALQCHVTDNLS